jgi:hypothetical protein
MRNGERVMITRVAGYKLRVAGCGLALGAKESRNSRKDAKAQREEKG